MEDLKIGIGLRLKTLRNHKGMTQKEFVKHMEEKTGRSITQATFSSYEKGIGLPSVPVLVNIAQAFQVSTDWLCGMETTDGLKTYNDVIRAIDDILSSTLQVHLDEFEFCVDPYGEGRLRNSAPCIVFYDKELIDYYDGLKKMMEAKEQGLIDDEIMSLWHEKMRKKYDKPLLPF